MVDPNPSWVSSTWTKRVDRNGLTYPSRDMFDLMVAFDRVVTRRCRRLNPKSLLTDLVIEEVFDESSVTLICGKLCSTAGVQYAEGIHTLITAVKYFLMVKGGAVARKVNENANKHKSQTLSLRHSLIN